MKKGNDMRRTFLLVLAVIVTICASPLSAKDSEDIMYSILFPGLGQYRTGRYTRATAFMGIELVALIGLGITDIQYDRSVEAYERAKVLYQNAEYIGDADAYYREMVSQWEDADSYHGYRNTFLGVAAGVWLINIADMVWGPEAEYPPLTLEIRNDGFLVSKSFSF